MSSRKWSAETASKRIDTRLSEVQEIKIKDYVRDTDLTTVSTKLAFRIDGVHLYIDILNISDMLEVTDSEGVIAHRRTLRFLNLHYRAVARALAATDAILVDFHNQRLHAVVAKPYGSEQDRIYKAIAIAQLVTDVAYQTSEAGDDPIPAPKLRIGIDSGIALAVNNGRRGHREPLFLGRPANLAAKRAAGGASVGIFVTDNVREVAEFEAADDQDSIPLSAEEIATAQKEASLDVTSAQILSKWEADLAANPIGRFEFSRHTPPYVNLDLETLSAANSRRQDAVSVYADIDGFTSYVDDHIDDDEDAKKAVKVLHVLRSELDSVLTDDFSGVKVRFVGDCIHGGIVEGTVYETDEEDTAKIAVMCAGALRSSFDLALEKLKVAGLECDLGLAIGMDYGPLALTRLGFKGELMRCAVGRCVIASEDAQLECSGQETGFGERFEKVAPQWVKDWFGKKRRASGVNYPEAVRRRDEAKTPQSRSSLRPATPAIATSTVATSFDFPGTRAAPTKPAGFA